MGSNCTILDDMLLKAAENGGRELYSKIIDTFSSLKGPLQDSTKEGIIYIIESWQLHPEDRDKGEFIFMLSKYIDGEFEELRSAFPVIIRKLLPKGINKTTAIKAIGVKSSDIKLSEIYVRFKKLIELKKSSKIFFNKQSKIWGVTDEIDGISGTISLKNITGKTEDELKLEVALDELILFKNSDELLKIVKDNKQAKKEEVVKLFNNNSLFQLDEAILRDMIFHIYVPRLMNDVEFNKWWNDIPKEDSEKKEQYIFARSIKELNNLLKKNKKGNLKIDNNIIEIFNKTTKRSNLISNSKDAILWVENLTIILKESKESDNVLKKIEIDREISELLTPDNILDSEIAFKIWLNLKISLLSYWITFIKELKGEKYLLSLLPQLPWKAWQVIANNIDREKIVNRFINVTRLGSTEALLWVWKNRKNIPNELLKKLNSTNLFLALEKKINKNAVWNSASKELRELLMGNEKFQRFIIEDEKNENYIIDLIERINNLTSLSSSEKQSIIIKLSRQFPIIKEIFRTGKGRTISKDGEIREKKNKVDDEEFLTSIKSYNAKFAELQNIINVQIPQNSRDIATARAHGDLRENAEYAAAKERQKYLNEQRARLESEILKTIPINFSEIKVKDRVTVGSTIEIEYLDNKEKEIFHILGAWDSEPDKKYIAYKTKLGETMINKRIGDIVQLPNGKRCKIINVYPIPEGIKRELNEEK